MGKNILAIGAFERDNFGDALFYYIAKKMSSDAGHQMTPASIIYAPTSQIGLEMVLPYDVLLSSETHWDAIWVLGGEVGGVDVSVALDVSFPYGLLEEYKDLRKDDRLTVRRILGAPDKMLRPAYIPNPRDYGLEDTKLIINSAGLSAPGGYTNTEINAISRDIYKTADYIGVRDRRSHDLVKKLNDKTYLSPDLVHAIPVAYPDLVEHKSSPYFVFQINEALCSRYEIEKIVEQIIHVAKDISCSVVLLPAGLAPSHDSMYIYSKINEDVNRGGVESNIVHNRDPLWLAKVIGESRLWIGSSLHGRIIASAYDVPRISLANTKVANYAKYWDKSYPIDVNPQKFYPIVKKVISKSGSSDGERLTLDTVKNMERILEILK